MTLKAKLAQLSSTLQDMERGIKLTLNSKPNLSEIEDLIKKETTTLYDRLKIDMNNLTCQSELPKPKPKPSVATATAPKCETQ